MNISGSKSEKTFVQRFWSTALWWGLPMLCVELIGVPKPLWGYMLVFALPATLVGVVGGALLEHYAIYAISRRAKNPPK